MSSIINPSSGGSGSSIPKTMTADFTIAARTQVYAHRKINVGAGLKIKIGEDAVLTNGASL